jgi:hypothetical protein
VWNNEGSGQISVVETSSSGCQADQVLLNINVINDGDTYCQARGNSDCSANNQNEYISNISLEGINNNSDCSDYTDYTNLSTSLVLGNTYTISIQTAVTGSSNTYWQGDEVAVWIDYNNNFSFDDEGERVGYVLMDNSWNNTFQFTVPEDITEAQVNMRCRISYNDNGNTPIESCGDSEWGEVEDYTINLVAENDPCNTFSITGLNPTDDYCGDGNGEIELLVTGGVIPYTYSLDNGVTTQSSPLFDNLNAGTYTVTVEDDAGCSLSETTTLNENPVSIVNVQLTHTSCGNDNGEIEVPIAVVSIHLLFQ